MDLDFTEEQIMLRTMARDFITKECPKKMVRELETSELGYSPEIWKQMADLGWQGLIIPEKYGGSEMNQFDLSFIIEEIGRNILPGPYLSTMVAAMAIMDAGSEEQKEEYLTKIASGDMILTLALTEPSASWWPEHVEVTAPPSGDNFIVNGTKLFIQDANIADYLLVVARTDKDADPVNGITVFLVDAKSSGITTKVHFTMGLDNRCEIVFDKVSVPKANILGELNKGWSVVQDVLRRATALKVAEMSGGCQTAVEMSSEYVKERVQYKKPIGSFQVIQHYMADMWGYMDRVRSLALEINWKVSAGVATPYDIAAAKAYAGDAYIWVTERAVQCHGAIGTTRDHDLGLYYRRARVAELDFGDTDYQLEVAARELKL